MSIMDPQMCDFPSFRAAYLQRAACHEASEPSSSTSQAPACAAEAAPRSKGPVALDLVALRDARADGPPSELQARREKYAFFEKQCSEVADGLYLGSDVVARSRDTLRAAGITHVINCVGFLYPAYFQDELTYLVLYLQDTPMEDIAAVLYEVFDFIESAHAGGGRVLLHCSQGVSRSATLAIAYLMWQRAAAFDEVLAAVKAVRGVANPNIGFICQLLNWHKRRLCGDSDAAMYRITPQCASAPLYLVPKTVHAPSLAALDRRGVFVVRTSKQTIIWQGARAPPKYLEAAERAAALLAKYEGAASPPMVVRDGEACAMLHCWEGSAVEREMQAPVCGCEVKAYNYDFQTYLEAVSGSSSPPDSCRTTSSTAPDTARTAGSDGGGSARAKTPRMHAADCGSPNHRSRKMRRADKSEGSLDGLE